MRTRARSSPRSSGRRARCSRPSRWRAAARRARCTAGSAPLAVLPPSVSRVGSGSASPEADARGGEEGPARSASSRAIQARARSRRASRRHQGPMASRPLGWPRMASTSRASSWPASGRPGSGECRRRTARRGPSTPPAARGPGGALGLQGRRARRPGGGRAFTALESMRRKGVCLRRKDSAPQDCRSALQVGEALHRDQTRRDLLLEGSCQPRPGRVRRGPRARPSAPRRDRPPPGGPRGRRPRWARPGARAPVPRACRTRSTSSWRLTRASDASGAVPARARAAS